MKWGYVAVSREYESLRKVFRGQVVVPGDADYEQHRRVWNLDVDRYPAVIVRCIDEDDVRAALRFAVDAGIEDVAVRGGGHSYPGLATCDDGLVIDLGLMRGARAGQGNRVFVQGGARLAHLDALTAEMGTAVPAGVEATTGVAGLTLGGGVGLLQRRLGLTCDSLRSVRMVTADGDIVVADDKREPELMWGLRGGGGSFGIVTEFEFQSHPINPAFVSSLFTYPLEVLDEFGRFFDEFAQAMPKDLACSLNPALSADVAQMIRGAASPTMSPDAARGAQADDAFAVNALWVGSPGEAENAIRPLFDWNPLSTMSVPTTHIQMQSMVPELGAPQNRYVRAGYINSLGDGVLEDCLERCDGGQPAVMLFIFSVLGGAIAEINEHDTAFSGRTAKYLFALEASWDEPSKRDSTVAWVRETYDVIDRFATGGNYANTVTDEGSPPCWLRRRARTRRCSLRSSASYRGSSSAASRGPELRPAGGVGAERAARHRSPRLDQPQLGLLPEPI